MSAQAGNPPAGSKAKKKKNKKKGGGAKAEDGAPAVNGTAEGADGDGDEEVEDASEPGTPIGNHTSSKELADPQAPPIDEPQRPKSNGTNHVSRSSVSGRSTGGPGEQDDDPTKGRLDALAKERDELKTEVTLLRQSLESMTAKHGEESGNLQSQLDDTRQQKDSAESKHKEELERLRAQLKDAKQGQGDISGSADNEEEIEGLKAQLETVRQEKDEVENSYQTLRLRVTELRNSVTDRLNSYKEELEETQTERDELRERNEQLQVSLRETENEHAETRREVDDLRSRTNTSQQNWVRERDDLIAREAHARDEFETAKQAMQDWEVLAMEERSQREHLSDKMAELEEQLLGQKEAYEKAAGERDSQNQTVDGLQRALRDIQDARKKELRELVENSQTQLEQLRTQLQSAEDIASTAQKELETARTDLERALPFEEQVREKNLLIGKLRHEAVILNDHLTKALRFLKQRKPEDMVDRQIVTNHVLHFISIDRSDPKKFQVLQLIAALLAWTDEQKEQAGLSRPGGGVSPVGSSALLSPQLSFRRTPSTPQLGGGDHWMDTTSSGGGAAKESLAELWSEFLEREAREGQAQSAQRSRKSSLASPPPVERTVSGGSGLGLVPERE